MTHTPTPWVIDPQYAGEVQTSSLKTIASCWYSEYERREIEIIGVNDCSIEEAKANAAYIVKCVNAHDKLVEALQVARALLLQEADVSSREGQMDRLEAGSQRITAALEGLE